MADLVRALINNTAGEHNSHTVFFLIIIKLNALMSEQELHVVTRLLRKNSTPYKI